MTHLNILFVEDTPLIVRATMRIFEKLGYRPDIAYNYEEASKLIQQKHYNLILTDIGLPDHSGIELTKLIRHVEKTQNREPAYICGATAFVIDDFEIPCYNAGMNNLVAKPITAAFLEETIEICCTTIA